MTRPPFGLACALLACALLAAAGCASGPSPRTFVLTTAMDSGISPPSTGAGPLVQLQAVSLPDYLDTQDMLLRNGPYELQASTTGRWGERLSTGLARSLTGALGIRLPEYRIEPARPRDKSARQVLVDVGAFDVWRDGRCALRASWTVLERGTGTIVGTGSGLFAAPSVRAAASADDMAVVACMASAVDQLAAALGVTVRMPTRE